MSTFDFMTPGEAFAASRVGVAEWQSIIGLKGAEADRVMHTTRTATGNMRRPEQTWEAHTGMGKHGKVIERVTRTRDEHNDADHGTVTVHFADGTSTYVLPGDLLCVERPV
jgi:hypothetical protein